MDVNKLCGWLGEHESQAAWEYMRERFPEFKIVGETEYKRTCAWDAWAELGFDINRSTLYKQEIGDCVSFGAAIAVAAVMAHEIVRDGEWEKFHVPFPPYLYGISRVMPEGGNGRLGNSDGSLGSWMADTIVKYGVLREDFHGVPKYSGSVAKQWGASRRAFDQFVDEADNHLMKTAAPVRSADELRDALCNGYYCTIASNRGFSMQLKDEKGKSWFVGRDSWAHQMSYIAYDEEPEPCVYIRNQWGTAHGRQLDGPDGGGWRRLSDEDSFLRSSGVECFAFSRFDGFPSEKEKPRNWFA